MQADAPQAKSAIDLLKTDHRKVEQLFEQFESTDDKRAKQRVAREICHELDIHAKIEERVFYPASKREADDAEDAVNEGIVEHQGIKMLVKKIAAMNPNDEYLDTSVKVLKEYVRHHVKEEETTMFPKIEASGLDLEALGRRLAQAKQRLMQGAKPRRAPKRKIATKTARRPAARRAQRKTPTRRSRRA